MKILITGSQGRLGSEVYKLASQKYSTYQILAPKRSELNLENSNAVARYIKATKPSHVIHLAGYVYGIGGHAKKPLDSLRTAQIDINIFSTLAIFPPTWIFYSSSVAVYSPVDSLLPHNEEAFLRGQPHRSENLYANVKRIAYFYLNELKHQHGTIFSYGILTNLFGAIESPDIESNHVIEALISKIKKAEIDGEPIPVWGDPLDSRDFISYKFAAKVILDLFDLDTGAVNIASGKEMLISHLISLIQVALNTNLEVSYNVGPSSVSRRFSSLKKISSFLPYVENYDSEPELVRYITERAMEEQLKSGKKT